MDRRIQKTRAAIFSAFYKLIQKQDYAKISIQNIIDEANIGRSTFYEHFETKDELLRATCKDLFEHIFKAHEINDKCEFPYSTDFSDKIRHILFHLLEDKKTIKGILFSESREIFLQYFRRYLESVTRDESLYEGFSDVPKEFILNHVVGSFLEAVLWWVARDFKESYIDLSEYVLKVLHLR